MEYKRLTQSKMTIPYESLAEAHVWGASAGLGPMDAFNEAVTILLACERQGREDLIVHRGRKLTADMRVVNVRIEHENLWGLKDFASSHGITQSSAMTMALDTLTDSAMRSGWWDYVDASARRRRSLEKLLGIELAAVTDLTR